MQTHANNAFDVAPIAFLGKLPTACGPKVYRLAKDGNHAVKAFGPLFTLAKAEAYQRNMIAAGFDVLVINTASGVTV